MLICDTAVREVAYELPVKAPTIMHDTSNMYKTEKVNYGHNACGTINLTDGTSVSFSSSALKNVSRIDERNLVFCKYLDLGNSTITHLDTAYLTSLRILVLYQAA